MNTQDMQQVARFPIAFALLATEHLADNGAYEDKIADDIASGNPQRLLNAKKRAGHISHAEWERQSDRLHLWISRASHAVQVRGDARAFL